MKWVRESLQKIAKDAKEMFGKCSFGSVSLSLCCLCVLLLKVTADPRPKNALQKFAKSAKNMFGE